MQPVIVLIFLLVALVSSAQSPPAQTSTPAADRPSHQRVERNFPISQTDLYCAGYISPHRLSHEHFVEAGLNTPVQAHFGSRDFIYLHGSGFVPGARVSIVREMHDPTSYTPFPAAQAMMKKAGQLYGELGYAKILENRGKNTAVAQIEFSCDEIAAGDLIVPFAAKEPVVFREQSTLNMFPENHGKVSGRILASRDFDQYLGSGSYAYISVGQKSGLKPGDYLRVVRNYDRQSVDPSDSQAFHEPAWVDTQSASSPSVSRSQLATDLPYHAIGELLVITTQPDTATVVVTHALEEIQLGDRFELE